MICVGIDGMNVSHLDEGEQSEKRQAHQDHHVSLWPRVATATLPCVKSVQKLVLWRDPTKRIHVLGCARSSDVIG
jgi:hypothetical protein